MTVTLVPHAFAYEISIYATMTEDLSAAPPARRHLKRKSDNVKPTSKCHLLMLCF
ncbi:hypothetical protein ACRRTK_023692 [Alexandromys fortis]